MVCSTSNRPIPVLYWLVVLPGLLFTLLCAAVYLHEWILIGVVAEPSTVANYHFGSEAMVGEGGWAYRSAFAYWASALVEGSVFLGLAIMFLLPRSRRSWRSVLSIYAFLTLALIATYLLHRPSS